ncbi:hypothetical protein SESBI_03659 [Sesbania bispinosa]|nr:hypothetical protein SESBI_03659 [Sesbania bispinosa]
MAAAASYEQVNKVSLSVLVDRERNRVVYAEAGKDFVDVLLSFLTLPLGTIARLIAKDSNMQSVRVGSLSSLYQSVADLDEQHLWTQNCKEMLLQPRNSMEPYCQKLKLNIDDTPPIQYFICQDRDCLRKASSGEGCLNLSTFRNKKCHCGKLLNKVIYPEKLTTENGFVNETAKFIISEDLNVMPNVFGATVQLFQKLGVHDFAAIEKKTVVDLLKFSLISKAPLTDFIFSSYHFDPRNESSFVFGDLPPDDGRKMVVKVLKRKSNGKILFAEVKEDFADFLFSFLTFPLGGVLNMLQGVSSLSCIDNLYKSMTELSPDRHLRSQDLKDKLAKPQCAPQFELSNQILPIGAATLPLYRCFINSLLLSFRLSLPSTISGFPPYYDQKNAHLKFVDPISRIPLVDLEERVISIGLKESLSILKASLTSASALTNGLNQFSRN